MCMYIRMFVYYGRENIPMYMYVRTYMVYRERYNRPQIMYMFLSCIYLQALMDMISNESSGVIGLLLNIEGIKGRVYV